jgi:glutamate synthase (NADPH/NADH) large chain
MSGGVAYVFDADGTFPKLCNMGMIKLEKVDTEKEQEELKAMIRKHKEKTESNVAEYILSDWNESIDKFVKVIPTDYKRMLGYIEEARSTGKYEKESDIIDAAFDMHLANL